MSFIQKKRGEIVLLEPLDTIKKEIEIINLYKKGIIKKRIKYKALLKLLIPSLKVNKRGKDRGLRKIKIFETFLTGEPQSKISKRLGISLRYVHKVSMELRYDILNYILKDKIAKHKYRTIIHPEMSKMIAYKKGNIIKDFSFDELFNGLRKSIGNDKVDLFLMRYNGVQSSIVADKLNIKETAVGGVYNRIFDRVIDYIEDRAYFVKLTGKINLKNKLSPNLKKILSFVDYNNLLPDDRNRYLLLTNKIFKNNKKREQIIKMFYRVLEGRNIKDAGLEFGIERSSAQQYVKKISTHILEIL